MPRGGFHFLIAVVVLTAIRVNHLVHIHKVILLGHADCQTKPDMGHANLTGTLNELFNQKETSNQNTLTCC